MKLTAAHYAILRRVARRCPIADQSIVLRDEVCDSLEDIRLLQDLQEKGLMVFRAYGGPYNMIPTYCITSRGLAAA